ncbi:MAG: hypothetical protein QXW01_03490 [Candidatus Aenigmatarchaeota archaeon]
MIMMNLLLREDINGGLHIFTFPKLLTLCGYIKVPLKDFDSRGFTDKGVFKCPSAIIPYPGYKFGGIGIVLGVDTGGHYMPGGNLWTMWWDDHWQFRPPAKYGKIKHPDKKAMLGDSEERGRNATYIQCPICYSNLGSPWPEIGQTQIIGYLPYRRHLGGGNVCFWDGHVEWVRYQDAKANKNDIWGHYEW